VQDSTNKVPAGVNVDIWHCDAQGSYSEYVGTGMQSINYTNVHFLRGRQTTNSNCEVSFNLLVYSQAGTMAGPLISN
jgi:protocatechuate 3,4-dioxygenase beta subunit